LNVYYSVDGGEPRYAVQHNGNLSKDDQWYTIIEEGIEGSTLTLYIEGQTSTLSESYHVDNIEVFATQNPVEEEEEEEEIYSVLTIYAAGKSGYEQMELRIDGKTVKGWDGIGGNVYDPIFEEYVYEHKGEKLKASQIQIVYVNDAGYQPYTGIRVGKIEIDGEVFETEASTTYGVGVYSDGECREGYMQSESLECGGYFRYMASEIKSYHLDINAFPNPAKDIQMLEFATNLDKVDVKIIDMQGVVKINYTGVNTADVLQLDLSTLHAGIYVIQVSSSSTYSETRIYKE